MEIRQNPAKTSSEKNENWGLFRIESGRAASRLFDYGFSAISSFMAREGITDLLDGVEAYYRGLCNHLNNRAANGGASFEGFVDERVAIKARRFNSILNKQAAEDELTSEEYRKASDGE